MSTWNATAGSTRSQQPPVDGDAIHAGASRRCGCDSRAPGRAGRRPRTPAFSRSAKASTTLDGVEPGARQDDRRRAELGDRGRRPVERLEVVEPRPRVRARDLEPGRLDRPASGDGVTARDVDGLDAEEPDLGDGRERGRIQAQALDAGPGRVAERVELGREGLGHAVGSGSSGSTLGLGLDRAARRSWRRNHSPATGRNQGRPSYGAGTSGNVSAAERRRLAAGHPLPGPGAEVASSARRRCRSSRPRTSRRPWCGPTCGIRSNVKPTLPPHAYSIR